MGLPLSRRSFLAACPAAVLGSGRKESAEVFRRRRRRLAEAVGTGVIALLGYGRREGQAGFTGFRQESNFYYLTGHDEPGASVLIAPPRRGRAYREVLFLPASSEMAERWSGPSLSAEGADALGFDDVLDAASLSRELRLMLRDRKGLAALRPREFPATGGHLEWPTAQALEEAADARIRRDVRGPLAALRAVKSPLELDLIREASSATEAAFRASWRAVAAGATEAAVVAELVGAAFRAGCRRLAFPPIAASGPNATILHYQRNDAVMRRGHLLLIDAGAECSRYAADLARTVPVTGRFTSRQRDLYDVVLKAQRAVLEAAKPGARLSGAGPRTLESIAEGVLRKHAPKGVDAFLPHAIGHSVGLDVHDPMPPGGTLKEGMVLAIEPGIYLPGEGVGIRVEDLVEITADGCRTMTAGLPKSADEIERTLAADSGSG